MAETMTATISGLSLYPVKGCRGFTLDEARLAATGLEIEGIGDREWVVTDPDGEFLSQRELPKMALIETRLGGGALTLKAPGMLRLDVPFESEGDVVKAQVWNDTIAAVTQGDLADAWFSDFLGTPCRLLRFDPEHRRLASRTYTGDDESPYKFADAFPLLLTSRASLAALNRRLSSKGLPAVGMERFRPNLVLDGIGDFEEDYIEELSVGDVRLRVVKPCVRCTVPSVDPATGEQGTEPGDTLAEFRMNDKAGGVTFGVNAIVLSGASRIRTGTSLDIKLSV